MSDLESKAAPILKRMVVGSRSPVEVSVAAQDTLARWAYKMSLMLDCTNPRRVLPDHLYSAFHDRGHLLPESALVWTAAYNTDRMFANYWQLESRPPPPLGALGPHPSEICKTTFTLGLALFQVLERLPGESVIVILESAYSPLFLRLFPRLGPDPILWPPQMRAMPHDLFDTIANEQTWLAATAQNAPTH